MRRKVLQRDALVEVVKNLRDRGKKVVFTNGCFDLIHLGHVRYLGEAKKHGDILVVGLNSDGSVRRLKGKGRPFVPERDRAELLAALEAVDYVTIFGEDTPAALIEALGPDLIVKGADYTLEEVVGRETVERSGGCVVIVPLVEDRSTTKLIEKIRRSPLEPES
jgi:rfaE bifunctional protein nucleotidyltransferase chain/domain